MKIKIVSSLVACAGLSTTALAADPWDSPFTIQAGAFWAKANTHVRFDSDTRLGTDVSLESDLGITDKKVTPDIEFLWRFNSRHAVEGSYVSLHRDGSRNAQFVINWGDVTFPVNTKIDSTFDSDVYRFAYRWSPVNENGNELALLAGVHWTTFKASARSSTGTVASDEANLNFPLPTFGVRASAAFSPAWRVTGYGQWLKLKIGDYDGSLLTGSIAMEWAFMRQAYAGLGYNYYKYKLTAEKEGARGKFDFRFDGPALYMGWAF